MERLIDRLIERLLPAGMPVSVALRSWFRESGYWYTTSFLVHAIGFVLLAIVLTVLSGCPGVLHFEPSQSGQTLSLESTNAQELVLSEVPRFEIVDAPLWTSKLSPDTLLDGPPAPQKEIRYDNSDTFVEAGGGTSNALNGALLGGNNGGFWLPKGRGAAKTGAPGVSLGDGDKAGAGDGRGEGLGQRGKGFREGLVGVGGGTGPSERAVAGGLNWMARHQCPGGNWSLQHTKHCKGGSCGGPGTIQADAAATAMALLAFQGAGQTHKAKGPYRERVQKGISWLLKHQNAKNGDLSAGSGQQMYVHGLATIALCEAYAMTRDEAVGAAATKAIRYIEWAQNEVTGGWRYTPHETGDTSVLGWQVMALKSGQLAGLGVNSMSFEGARKFLGSVAQGQNHGLYVYQPYREVSPSMTAVGMLCQQYLGCARDDPAMLEGRQYLLANLPDPNLQRDVYYWYYATLAMHNFMGPEWDRWNRQMRRTLITTQCKGGCAEGSWDPERPMVDKWSQAGRLYVTALSTLTLEVYYRYLPLFDINQDPATSPRQVNKMGLAVGMPAAPSPDKPVSRTQ